VHAMEKGWVSQLNANATSAFSPALKALPLASTPWVDLIILSSVRKYLCLNPVEYCRLMLLSEMVALQRVGWISTETS
jgi:hypothetical protein